MLVCATVWVVSCSNDDNAVIEPADGPGAAYRAVLRGLEGGECHAVCFATVLP